MDSELLRKIVEDSVKLYSPPQTLSEVLRIIADETSSADDLAKILMKDPAVTARMLRVVNSPYYGTARKIGSVTQAVSILGTRQVTALVMATSIYGLTERWESALDRVRFWRHSLEVAIASRNIASQVGLKCTEEMFVGGLLHDIGILILENSFTDRYRQIWQESQAEGSLTDLEEDTWGTNHARVGQFLLEQWQLPELICETVGRHHSVFIKGPDNEELAPGQIVNLANLISQFPILDVLPADAILNKENRQTIAENLKLSSEDILSIQKDLLSQTISESKYLEFDVGSTDEILIEANRMLFQQYVAVETLLEQNRRMQQQAAGGQVTRAFLEGLKSTTSMFAHYVCKTTLSIRKRAESLQSDHISGVIASPDQIASSVEAIVASAETLDSIAKRIRKLSRTEAALYYDHGAVREVEESIKSELAHLEEPTGVA